MAGREAGIDRVAVKARMVALQKEIELRRTVEGLGEWWSEHFDTPFRLLGAVPTDAPERLAELGPALEAARAVAEPTVMPERDPQLVVPFEELWRGVAETVAALPEPGAEVTLVAPEFDALVALRMTGHQFRASAEVWLTPEGGLHVLLFADGTVLSLERDREYAPDGAPGDHVALWRGLPGTRSSVWLAGGELPVRDEEAVVSATPQEIFQRYVYAGAMTRNADALAELFTEDGVLEAPLLAAGSAFPRRTAGREAIRAALAEYYARPVGGPKVPNLEKSGYVLHTTADPDVFIAEIDTVFDGEEGEQGEEETVSLVQVFRLRDGKIARLRDYFAPSLV